MATYHINLRNKRLKNTINKAFDRLQECVDKQKYQHTVQDYFIFTYKGPLQAGQQIQCAVPFLPTIIVGLVNNHMMEVGRVDKAGVFTATLTVQYDPQTNIGGVYINTAYKKGVAL